MFQQECVNVLFSFTFPRAMFGTLE